MSPCYPSSKTLECAICARYRPGMEFHPEHRHILIIDASVVRGKGVCPMYEEQPTTRPYCEAAEREVYA